MVGWESTNSFVCVAYAAWGQDGVGLKGEQVGSEARTA